MGCLLELTAKEARLPKRQRHKSMLQKKKTNFTTIYPLSLSCRSGHSSPAHALSSDYIPSAPFDGYVPPAPQVVMFLLHPQVVMFLLHPLVVCSSSTLWWCVLPAPSGGYVPPDPMVVMILLYHLHLFISL